jgi:hypothetical protein
MLGRACEAKECYIFLTFHAATGRSFLLFAQKKRTKEKGTRYCLHPKINPV